MSELKTVKVGSLEPNPYRDGKGEATWETLAASYPINPAKTEKLRESFLSEREGGKKLGVWESIIARPAGKGYQIAFGHHRVVTFKELVEASELPDGLPIIVKELSDADMILYMARENDEEWRHRFLLAVMNPIEAVLAAYGAGTVELEQPDPKTPGVYIRMLSPVGDKIGKSYTDNTIGRFLGWTKQEGKAQPKVRTALDALALIAGGLLERSHFLVLTHSEAEELVRRTKVARKQKEDAIEAEISVKREELKKAEKQGDKNKAAKVEEYIERAEERLKKEVARETKNVGDFVAKRFAEGESIKAVRAELDVDSEAKKVSPRAAVDNPARVETEELTVRVDAFLKDDNPKWKVVLTDKRDTKRVEMLKEALVKLGARAKNRAKELED